MEQGPTLELDHGRHHPYTRAIWITIWPKALSLCSVPGRGVFLMSEAPLHPHTLDARSRSHPTICSNQMLENKIFPALEIGWSELEILVQNLAVQG